MKNFVLAILLMGLVMTAIAGNLITYDAPKDAEATPEFELEVNGQKIFVYNTRIAALAYFSFEGKVDVKITFLSPISDFDIRPKSRNIKAELYRNQIRFSLDKPENLSVEINKNIKPPLFIFANPLGTNVPDKADKNVTFRNCDLIHTEGPEGTFTIHNGDRAVVKNVLYEDIRVEDSKGWLIDFKILQSQYSKDKQRGKIENVKFKNIMVEGEIFPYSQLLGFDENHRITGITLENMVINGTKVTSTYNGMITTVHADEIIFK